MSDENTIKIQNLDDLKALQTKSLNGENVEVIEVSKITHTIKLKGERFNHYKEGYITADIAKIVLSYQKSFCSIVSALEKYGIGNIDKTQLLAFKIEQGCLKIDIQNIITPLLEGVKNMSDTSKVIIIISISLMILGGYSYSEYLTHNENLAKIDAENKNRHIIAGLKSDKKLQNAINSPKLEVASTLKKGETATFNNDPRIITYDKTKDYKFKELIDTTTTSDEVGEFQILGYEKINNGDKKFKIDINGIKWVSANLISADARIKLATAIESGKNIKLKIRTIKEYNQIKEIIILDLIGDGDE